ncbi:hypothetical protein GCM10028807_23330 [Spirosoma daeguense]
MSKTTQILRVDPQLNIKFAGTTVDTDEVRSCFMITPSRRDETNDAQEYIKEAYWDDVEKAIYNHFTGSQVELPLVILNCRYYKYQAIHPPELIRDFVYGCLEKIRFTILQKSWYYLMGNLQETQQVLYPILAKLEEEVRDV